MTDASEILWISGHGGEYGRYYPSAVEAEGEHGGKAVGYVGADLHKAQAKRIAELELKLAARNITISRLSHVNRRSRIAKLELKLENLEEKLRQSQIKLARLKPNDPIFLGWQDTK